MADTNTLPTKARNDQGLAEATRGGAYFTPRVDIFESEQELVLTADLPGVRPDDVELRYENGELLLYARLPSRTLGGTLLLGEYEVGDFYRVFTIHESIDNTKISAECKNGVLTVHLPKVEAAKPRQIAVKGS
jgi:HSP20 family protein